MQRILVLGGNGYVGQNIIRAALDSGKFSVASLSRSGKPSNPGPCLANAEMLDKVEWLEGDIFDAQRRDETFEGVDVIVSTIGAFGSNQWAWLRRYFYGVFNREPSGPSGGKSSI